MSSNTNAGSSSTHGQHDTNEFGPSIRWSEFYEGPPLDLSQPGYDYVAHPVVNNGPDPVSPPPGRPVHKNIPFLAGTKKLFRRMSYNLKGKSKERAKRAAAAALSPSKTGVKALFGTEAEFIPIDDPQLNFSGLGSQKRAQLDPEKAFEWNENITYCDTCQVNYLVGKAGPKYADLHPHHLATLNNERTIAIVNSLNVYDYAGDPWLEGLFFFGPSSEHNRRMRAGPFKTAEEAWDFGRGECLVHFFQNVMIDRMKAIKSCTKVPDSPILQGDTELFRLIVFTQYDGLPPVGGTETGMQQRLTAIIEVLAKRGIETRWHRLSRMNSLAELLGLP